MGRTGKNNDLGFPLPTSLGHVEEIGYPSPASCGREIGGDPPNLEVGVPHNLALPPLFQPPHCTAPSLCTTVAGLQSPTYLTIFSLPAIGNVLVTRQPWWLLVGNELVTYR
ncbi:hypothetical protein TIFTF001_046158 [Ficus carica]|uniref:Uncharacterized protein n=1 Tax=Ficus carica TaxID=3494 RepID=A0AA87Z0L9_FICCA|nr:hypothetical protein TIFTF001_046151 [Ficus carica]GMN27599.1 hypothetical protein TIFTF001_046154 [Ficus carica]GMN27621.1 hypothetical protein TIFTF001_046155 [Ficus carica]GMN27638.1 hypothetical protein TIFTF001_046158 [Ficus carica]